MANAMDFIDPANRLAVLEQVTAEGMLSLKKDTIRGNEYHVFAEAHVFAEVTPDHQLR